MSYVDLMFAGADKGRRVAPVLVCLLRVHTVQSNIGACVNTRFTQPVQPRHSIAWEHAQQAVLNASLNCKAKGLLLLLTPTLVLTWISSLLPLRQGFAIIIEPFDARLPSIPDPVMQLCCLDASLAMKVCDSLGVAVAEGTGWFDCESQQRFPGRRIPGWI